MSVVQLYAGAFFPGIMLAGLYVVYVIGLAKLRPGLMPPLPESERRVPLSPVASRIAGRFGPRVLAGLAGAFKGSRNADLRFGEVARQALVAAGCAARLSYIGALQSNKIAALVAAAGTATSWSSSSVMSTASQFFRTTASPRRP